MIEAASSAAVDPARAASDFVKVHSSKESEVDQASLTLLSSSSLFLFISTPIMALLQPVKRIFSNCNVELVVIVFGVAVSMSVLVAPLVLYQVVCQQTLHSNFHDFKADLPPAFQNSTRKLICESMGSKTLENGTTTWLRRLEFEVQETATYWFMVFGVARTLSGLVSDVVLAAYSDRCGRKKVILLGLFGVFLVMATVPLMYEFPLHVPLSVVALVHVVAGATGFGSSLLLAFAAYLADTVEDHEQSLTARMTILQLCRALPMALGSLLASAALKAIDYAQVMILTCCLIILAFVYALVRLKKVKPGNLKNLKGKFGVRAQMSVQVQDEFEYPAEMDARIKKRIEYPAETDSQVQGKFEYSDRMDAQVQEKIEIPATLKGFSRNNGQTPSKSQLLDPTEFGRPEKLAAPSQNQAQGKIKFHAELEQLVQQSSESVPNKIKKRALSSWLLAKSVWDTYAKPRDGHSRAYLWLMGLVFLIYTTTDTAVQNNIFSLYVQKAPLLWREDMISCYRAAVGLLKLAGATIGVIVMKKIIHLSDTLIILLSTLSSMVQLILTAFARESWMLFVAAGAGALSALANPCIQSFVAKLVAADEVGKSYTAFSLASNFACLASSTLTGAIYRATLSHFPGLMFLFMAMLLVINFVAVAWMHLDSRRQSDRER